MGRLLAAVVCFPVAWSAGCYRSHGRDLGSDSGAGARDAAVDARALPDDAAAPDDGGTTECVGVVTSDAPIVAPPACETEWSSCVRVRESVVVACGLSPSARWTGTGMLVSYLGGFGWRTLRAGLDAAVRNDRNVAGASQVPGPLPLAWWPDANRALASGGNFVVWLDANGERIGDPVSPPGIARLQVGLDGAGFVLHAWEQGLLGHAGREPATLAMSRPGGGPLPPQAALVERDGLIVGVAAVTEGEFRRLTLSGEVLDAFPTSHAIMLHRALEIGRWQVAAGISDGGSEAAWLLIAGEGGLRAYELPLRRHGDLLRLGDDVVVAYAVSAGEAESLRVNRLVPETGWAEDGGSSLGPARSGHPSLAPTPDGFVAVYDHWRGPEDAGEHVVMMDVFECCSP